jgi:hypothetical protein
MTRRATQFMPKSDTKAQVRRTTNSTTITTGSQRMVCGSRWTKLPSSIGFISAANAGSVAAPPIMPISASANTRQCGRA